MAKGENQTAEENIKPDFIHGLQDAEENPNGGAGSPPPPDDDNPWSATDEAGTGEDVTGNAAGFISNVTGKSAEKRKPLIARILPTTLVVSSVGLGGFVLGGLGLIAQPFHMLANMGEHFNTQNLGLEKRSTRIFRYVIDSKKNPTYGVLNKKYKTVSKKIVNRLKTQGIDVIDTKTGKPCTSACAPSHYELYEGDASAGGRCTGNGCKVTVISADDYIKVTLTNENFRYGFINATRTKFESFQDKVAQKVFKKFGILRNTFKTWSEDLKNIEGGNRNKFLQDTVTANTSVEIEDTNNDIRQTTETDADGDETTKRTNTSTPGSMDSAKAASKSSRLKAASNFVLSKFSTLSGASNVFCATMTVGATISVIAGVTEIQRMAKYFGLFAETVDKVKAGEGVDSPINEMMKLYNTPVVRQDAAGEVTGSGDSADINAYYKSSGEPAKSAMESDLMTWVTTGAAPNVNSASVQKFSIENSVKSLGDHLRNAGQMITNCAIANIVANVISMAITAIPVVGQVAKVGTTAGKAALKLSAKTLGKTFAKGATIAILVQQGLTHFIPKIAEAIATDYLTDALGEDLGTLTVAASHSTMAALHQGGGGVAADKDTIITYHQENQKLIAEHAAIERAEKSPFDTTSKYTFLGSIVNNTLPDVSNLLSVTGIFSALGSMFSRSITSLLPTTQALDQAAIQTSFGDCPALNSIGAEGGPTCSPWLVSPVKEEDVSMDPQVLYDYLVSNQDIEIKDEEQVKIKDDSQLSKFLKYCSNRESQLGVSDPSIVTDQTMLSTGDPTGDAIIDALPIIGDIKGIIESTQQLDPGVQNWANGQNCVDTPTNTETRESIKYWQIYMEDERLLEQIGDGDYTSPITAYLDNYETQHPGYNSTTALLAKAAGVETEDMLEALTRFTTGQNEEGIGQQTGAINIETTYFKLSSSLPANDDTNKVPIGLNVRTAAIGMAKPIYTTL
ncbi:MAG: hypothetical protein LBL84_01660 [Candidatus Nomurabacteria bacterium]|jgi:hypothetical protein|nr:hypothetical protein [Candidatus Nomurabacteria bacterium]